MKKVNSDSKKNKERERFGWRLNDYQERELKKIMLTDEEAEKLFIQIEYQMSSLAGVDNSHTAYKSLLVKIEKNTKQLEMNIRKLNKGDMNSLNYRLLKNIDGLHVLTVDEFIARQKAARIKEEQRKELGGEELKQFELDEFLKGDAHKPQAISALAVLDTIQKEMKTLRSYYSNYCTTSLHLEALAKAYLFSDLRDAEGILLTKKSISSAPTGLFVRMCQIILNEKGDRKGMSDENFKSILEKSNWFESLKCK
jgi:hypothetical protein